MNGEGGGRMKLILIVVAIAVFTMLASQKGLLDGFNLPSLPSGGSDSSSRSGSCPANRACWSGSSWVSVGGSNYAGQICYCPPESAPNCAQCGWDWPR